MDRQRFEVFSQQRDDYAAPDTALRALNGLVPEFADVRRRLREAKSPLWDRLAAEYDALGSRLRMDRDAFKQMRTFERKLSADEELSKLVAGYLQGLCLISFPLGDPLHLRALMMNEDLQPLIAGSRFKTRLSELMNEPESRAPGTWTGTLHWVIGQSALMMAGMSSPLDLMRPGGAKTFKQGQEDWVRQIKRKLKEQAGENVMAGPVVAHPL
jgi:hypothetical protein